MHIAIAVWSSAYTGNICQGSVELYLLPGLFSLFKNKVAGIATIRCKQYCPQWTIAYLVSMPTVSSSSVLGRYHDDSFGKPNNLSAPVSLLYLSLSSQAYASNLYLGCHATVNVGASHGICKMGQKEIA